MDSITQRMELRFTTFLSDLPRYRTSWRLELGRFDGSGSSSAGAFFSAPPRWIPSSMKTHSSHE